MLTLAILGAGTFGCVVVISWLWRFSSDLLRRPIENARQQLTAKGFAVTYGMMSVKRDLMIALDAKQRVALCEFGRRGVVLTTRIVDRSELTVAALEDGEPLDETSAAGASAGRLVLSTVYKHRAYEVVFSLSVPRAADSPPNYEEYARMRGMVVWWRETLSGRTQDRPYPVASQLAVYSSGSVVEEIVAEYLRERGVLSVPEARLMTKPSPFPENRNGRRSDRLGGGD